VLLDGGRGVLRQQLGQVGRDVIAFDRGQAQALGVRPGEESHGVAEGESGGKAGQVRYWQYGQGGGKRDRSAIGNMGKRTSRLT